MFFHVTNLPEDVEPNLNDAVTYAVGEDRNGRPKAVEITFCDQADNP
jgi:hypothetical protein